VAQTLFQLGELEIVVVEPGVSATERDVLRRFQRSHKNLVAIAVDPDTPARAARNIGITAAQGTYLAVANASDRHRRNALELMKLALDERADVSLVYADSYIADDPAHPFGAHAQPRTHRNPDYFPPSALLTQQFGPQPMWRKSVHAEIGLFEEALRADVSDHDFNLRFALYFNAIHLPIVLGQYIDSRPADSSTADKAEPQIAQMIQRYRSEEMIRRLYTRAGIGATTNEDLAHVYNDLGVRSARYFRPEGTPGSDPEFAMQCFLWSIEQDHAQVAAYNNLFCVLVSNGNLAEANSLLEKLPTATVDPIFKANLERFRRDSPKAVELRELVMVPSSLSLPTEETLNTTEGESALSDMTPQRR
jgi:hypothetical protein